jgi:hypothetical protein
MREVHMPGRRLICELSRSQVEMKELGLEPVTWPVGWTFLFSLALANVAATTLTLLSQ